MRIAAGILAIAFGLSISAASADVIKERRDNFKINKESMKLMKEAIPAGDTATIAERARIVASWSARMVEYFPSGSDTGDTKARPIIWSQFDKFTTLAGNAEAAALELAALADGGAEPKELGAGLGKLGASCKSCHMNFKKD